MGSVTGQKGRIERGEHVTDNQKPENRGKQKKAKSEAEVEAVQVCLLPLQVTTARQEAEQYSVLSSVLTEAQSLQVKHCRPCTPAGGVEGK